MGALVLSLRNLNIAFPSYHKDLSGLPLLMAFDMIYLSRISISRQLFALFKSYRSVSRLLLHSMLPLQTLALTKYAESKLISRFFSNHRGP